MLADGPSGYWRLAEAGGTFAYDQTGRNSGAYKNGVALGAAGALATDPDTAAALDGGNDRVEWPDPADGSLDVGTADFSVEAWLKLPGELDTERGLIGKNGPGSYWLVNVTDDSGHKGQLRTVLYDGVAAKSMYSLHRFDDGRWHHVVAVVDRDSGIRLFVDGVSSGFAPGAVYNLQPNPGEPARLGISILGLINNQAAVSLFIIRDVRPEPPRR